MRIVVLGMHRSGTSALTRLLGFIGCRLGDAADFNPVRPDNPVGDWERSDVWAVNEAALAAGSASWCRIHAFDPARLTPAVRADLEARAGEVVARLDAAGGPWAIKDPRLCLTLPIWRAALEAPVCVLVHRDPLSVAHSLARRDGFPLLVGVALWEAHVLGALRHSVGLPRVAVSHRSVLDDPAGTLRALRRELGAAGVGGLRDADDAEVRGFIDPALDHVAPDPAEPSPLNPAQRRLADALQDGSALAWERDGIPEASAAALDLIEGYFDLRQGLDDATAERDRQAAAYLHKAEEVERLAASRDAAEARIGELEELLRQAEELGRQNEALRRENALLLRRCEEQAEAGRAQAQEARTRLLGAEKDMDVLVDRAREMARLIELILTSKRFRYGNLAGEVLGKALLRAPQPSAADHARRIVADFDSVCRDIASRRAARNGD